MREFFFILLVLLVLFGITAYRYRKQLRFGLEIWRALKSARQMGRNAQTSDNLPNATQHNAIGELVNCAKCSSWISEDQAIRFGKSIYYCSTKCLESKTAV